MGHLLMEKERMAELERQKDLFREKEKIYKRWNRALIASNFDIRALLSDEKFCTSFPKRVAGIRHDIIELGRLPHFTCYTENCNAPKQDVLFRCLKDFGGTFCKKCFYEEITAGACPEEQ